MLRDSWPPKGSENCTIGGPVTLVWDYGGWRAIDDSAGFAGRYACLSGGRYMGHRANPGDPSSQHPPRQTVIEVTPEQTRIAVQTTSGNPYEIDLNSAGAVTVSGPTQYRPGRGYVHFPLSVGASWDENYTATATGRETSWVAHHVTVDGAEIVHVVAGDFFAFRLVARGEVDRVVKGAYHRGSTFTETYWYAPSVKRVIKHESTNYYYGASADDLNWELYNYSLVDPLKPAAAAAKAP